MANTLDKIKISGVTYDIIDATAVHSLDGYYTSSQTNDAITAATISSRAFLNSINKAHETYKIALGETPSVDAWSGATTQQSEIELATDTITTNDTTAIDTLSETYAQIDSLNP